MKLIFKNQKISNKDMIILIQYQFLKYILDDYNKLTNIEKHSLLIKFEDMIKNTDKEFYNLYKYAKSHGKLNFYKL